MIGRLATIAVSLAVLVTALPVEAQSPSQAEAATTHQDPVNALPTATAAAEPAAIGEPVALPTGGALWTGAAPYFDFDDRDLIVATNIQRHELYYAIGNAARIDLPGWRAIPGPHIRGRPAVARVRTADSDRILVAAVDANSTVVVTWFEPDAGHSDWTSVPNGGEVAFHDDAGPALAVTPDGDVVLLAVGADFGIYQQRWHAGAWAESWSLWAPANTTGAALAAVWHEDKVKVFANLPEPDGTGRIKHADLGAPPVWAHVSTTAPQGALKTDEPPTAASSAPGVITVAAKGISAATAESIQFSNLSAGTFGPWRRMVSNSTWRVPQRPAALTSNEGNLHVYAIGLDSTLGVVALKPGLNQTNPDPQFLQGAEGFSGQEFRLVPGSVPAEYSSTPNGAPDWPRSAGLRTGPLNPDPWADPATKGASGVAAAQFGYASQNLIVVRKMDGSLVATIGRDGGSSTSQPEAWASFGFGAIPGLLPTGQPATTPYEPAAVKYGDRVWVAIVAEDKRMYFQLFDPETRRWNSNWTEVPGDGLFIASPTLAVWHGMLQVLGVFPNKRVGWRSSFRPDERWQNLPPIETTTAVGATQFEDELVVVARPVEGDRLRYFAIASFGSGEYGPGWADGLEESTTAAGRPSVTGTWLGLYTVSLQANHYFYSVRNGGVSTGWERVPSTEDPVSVSPDTRFSPSVVHHAGNLDMFAIGYTRREVFTETFVIKADRTLTPKTPHERWPMVPKTDARDFTSIDGGPVPPPPVPGSPQPAPELPAYQFFNHCLRGANVADEYVPALGRTATEALAAATAYATTSFGPTGWTLTAVPAEPVDHGCADPVPFHLCARWTRIPPAPPAQTNYWAEYIVVHDYTLEGAIQQLKERDWKPYWAAHPDPDESLAWSTYPSIPPDEFEYGLAPTQCDDDV